MRIKYLLIPVLLLAAVGCGGGDIRSDQERTPEMEQYIKDTDDAIDAEEGAQ